MNLIRVATRSICSGRALRDEVRSSGAIFDPYVYRGPGGTPLPPVWSTNGFKSRLGIMRGHLVSGVSAGIIQKNVPEFHAKKFPPIANEVFTSFLEAHRTGDLFALAGLTTDQMYTTIKAEIKRTAKSGEPRGAFRLLAFAGPTHVLQMRHTRKRTSQREGWGQVTCKLSTERDMILVDSSGNEVGSEDGLANRRIQNTSIGTFEVFFGDKSKRWRLALLEELGTPSDIETPPSAPL